MTVYEVFRVVGVVLWVALTLVIGLPLSLLACGKSDPWGYPISLEDRRWAWRFVAGYAALSLWMAWPLRVHITGWY